MALSGSDGNPGSARSATVRSVMSTSGRSQPTATSLSEERTERAAFKGLTTFRS